jgi:hypothetical protein
MQLKIDGDNSIVFEWIPYNQFNKIKEIENNNYTAIYSAIWKNGPLYKSKWSKNYKRDSNKKVALKYLYNLQNTVESLINEVQYFYKYLNTFFIKYTYNYNLFYLCLRLKNTQQKMKYFLYYMEYLKIQIQKIIF